MPEPTLYENALSTLENNWGTLVARYRRLSPDDQVAYLQRQGYARLADLLAHVAAWWSDGRQRVALLLADPNLPHKDYDVDAFNAAAVEAARPLTEEEIIAQFETGRQAMLALVRSLGPAGLDQHPRVVKRLEVEIIGHYDEHAL